MFRVMKMRSFIAIDIEKKDVVEKIETCNCKKEDKMEKRYFLLTFLICTIVTMFTLGACSREKSIETGKGKVTIKEQGKKIEVKTEDGSLTMTGDDKKGQINIKTEEGETINVSYGKGKLPDNFPKDVPIYSPSEVTVSQVVDEEKSVMVSLSSKDDPSIIAKFYKKKLPQEGWKIKNEMSMGNMVIIQGEKGEKVLNVTVNKDDQNTIISLVIGEK